MRSLIFAALMLPLVAWAGTFEQDFAVVFIDAKAEAEFGPIPLSRDVLAQGINRIAKAGARGLVLKFFLDQSKDERGDSLLAEAFSQIPTVLQARLDNAEPRPNLLAERFMLAGSFKVAAAGTSGWIPLPRFAKNASDVGFVDFNSTTVPMVEQYQGRGVKSLVLCAIELAEGRKAVLHPGVQIDVGRRVIKVDGRNQVIAGSWAPESAYAVSFSALMRGADASALRNKVVMLAYDGPHIDTVATPYGTVGAHRYFVNILRSIYDGDTN